MSYEIIRCTSAIGAEVRGISLVPPLSDDLVGEITDLLSERLVLFFRDQPITPAQQLQLAEQFGTLSVAPIGPKDQDTHALSVWDYVAPRGLGMDNWHADNTFVPKPPSITILKAVQLPSIGGDTLWASMFEAHDALSPPMQAFLQSLTAEHSITKRIPDAKRYGIVTGDTSALEDACPPVVHPAVRTQPRTGRKALYVNKNWTTRLCGLSPEESDLLLGHLFDHVGKPDFQVRFRWTKDAIAIYDNSWVQHYAVPDYTERRVMHRVNVEGPVPE